MTAAFFACGAGVGLGLFVIGVVLHRAASPRWRIRLNPRRLSLALAAVSATAFVTGWPVGALLVGGFVYATPTLLGGKRLAERTIVRTEAVAAWTETLRDTLAAAAGLQQAVLVTAEVAPAAISHEVATLADRVRARWPLPQALRAFADELSDATADLVVSTLVLAYERRAGNLAALLGALAHSAREEAAMQRRIVADRARIRAGVAVVTVFTLSAFALLVLFNRSFLRPYDSFGGQLVLAVVGAMFSLGFLTLHRLARLPVTERVLTAGVRPSAALGSGAP